MKKTSSIEKEIVKKIMFIVNNFIIVVIVKRIKMGKYFIIFIGVSHKKIFYIYKYN